MRGTIQQTPEIDLIGLETAGKCHTEFRSNRRTGVQIHTLFENTCYYDIPPSQIKHAVKKKLSELDPDAVAICGYTLAESQAAIAWGRHLGRAVVLMSNSTLDDRPQRWCRMYIKKGLIHLCDSALVGGTQQKEYLMHMGMKSNYVFMGYGVVDTDFFFQTSSQLIDNPKSSHASLQFKPGYILSVSRFVPEKNLFLAMESYAKYRVLVGEGAWKWILCGDGPLKGDIIKTRRKFSLDNHFILPGYISTVDLPEYYVYARVFWLPSVSETWGLVVNEAMACGLPVLVSNRAGCSHDLIVPGVNGWTFDPTSVNEMAQMLCQMHNTTEEQQKAMRQQSRTIISNWGPKRFAEGLKNAVITGIEHAKTRHDGLSFTNRLILRDGL
jgi:glycosyltransferase involved in cell wall biosynthesis